MTMQKNWRRYIGTVSRGEAKKLQGINSKVSLNIPPGLPGVYICRVHPDHARFTRHGIVPESECIVGPFVEFKFKHLQGTPEDELQKTPEAFYEIFIPHCVSERKHWEDVKVRHGDDVPGKDNQQVVFQEIPSKANRGNAEMYYEMNEHFIKIYTKRFCHFICSRCSNRCDSKLMIFLFGKLEPSEEKTSAEIKAFLCCELYSIADYKSVSSLNILLILSHIISKYVSVLK